MRRAAAVALGVLLSGLLLALALPPHGFSFLGWIAFVPLLRAVKERGFAVGFVSGIASSAAGAFFDAQGWLLQPGVEDGSPAWIYAGFILFGLVGGMTGGIYGASRKLSERPWTMAAFAVLFEGCLLAVLPAHLGLTQSRSTALLWLASITAIWGVSYLLWFVNLRLAKSLSTHPLQSSVVIVLGSLLSTQWAAAEKGSFGVGLLQTRSQDVTDLSRLNRRAGEQGASLSVWPELSGYAAAPGGDARAFERLAREPGQPAFATTFESPGNPLPYNVCEVFSSAGTSKPYRKRKLFAGERQLHAAGDTPVAVLQRGFGSGLNICFDSCYPSVLRDTARLAGVDFILLPTLDPDTPRGVAQAIHAAYTPFRAAELGLPILRADTTAYSMAVDSRGRVIVETGTDEDQILVASILPGKRWTLVTVAGDWFLYLCVALALAGLRGKASARQGASTSIG